MATGNATRVAMPTCSSVPMIACAAPPPSSSGPTVAMSEVKKVGLSCGAPLMTM